MTTLKASKAALYRLLRGKAKQMDLVFPMPAKKEVSFREAGDKSYVLSWKKHPESVRACLIDFLEFGFAVLSVEVYEDGQEAGWDLMAITEKDLEAYGMLAKEI